MIIDSDSGTAVPTTIPTGTPTPPRTERILVLYGSQTGNAEQAARDFCAQCANQLEPLLASSVSSSSKNDPPSCSSSTPTMTTTIPTPATTVVQPVLMQLDDFLEVEHAAWTRLVVIFVSSYGVGGAPLGAYRFRELCDAWLMQDPHDQSAATAAAAVDSDTDNVTGSRLLDGVSVALCGLGDSKYRTYFENPNTIDRALRAVGATRVGPLGQADASGTEDQQAVIQKWTRDIWVPLARAILVQNHNGNSNPEDAAAAAATQNDRLLAMQRATVELCRKINPDYHGPPPSSTLLCQEKGHTSNTASRMTMTTTWIMTILAIGVALVSVWLAMRI